MNDEKGQHLVENLQNPTENGIDSQALLYNEITTLKV